MISHSVGSLQSFILMLKFPEVWSAGVPSRQLLYPFDLPPIILLSSSFFSGTTRCSKLIFYLLFSRLEISHVFKELFCLFSVRTGISKSRSECWLHAFIATSVSLFIDPFRCHIRGSKTCILEIMNS